METYHVALGAGLTGVSGSSARGADVVDGWVAHFPAHGAESPTEDGEGCEWDLQVV